MTLMSKAVVIRAIEAEGLSLSPEEKRWPIAKLRQVLANLRKQNMVDRAYEGFADRYHAKREEEETP